MADDNQNPGRKWRQVENDGDGNRYFDSYRFTPHTTDTEFFRDPRIYQTEVARTTQQGQAPSDSPGGAGPRGLQRSDERIRAEIEELLSGHGGVDARNFRVEVIDGTVTLSGNVHSQREKQTAEGIAGNVLGVQQVDNRLSVNS